jgi:aryl-alcohol dehydrogenase-like predicted oxidoreductase
MNYIRYNKFKVSNLILGSVQFGLDYGIAKDGKPNQDEINSILNFSYDNGINCIDTALDYGNSEKSLSKFLQNKKDMLVITKISSKLFKEDILNNIEISLNNLGLSSLYGLLLHDSKLLYNWDKSYDTTINNLKKYNKIQNFGVSVYDEDEFNLAIKNNNINFIQVAFNIFDLRAIKFDYFQKAKKYNKLLLIRSIFLQGLLIMDESKIPSNLQKVKPFLIKFSKYAKEMHMSKIELAFSFVYHFAKENIMIFGCNNLLQAKENIKAFNNIRKINQDKIQELISSFKNINSSIYDTRKW